MQYKLIGYKEKDLLELYSLEDYQQFKSSNSPEKMDLTEGLVPVYVATEMPDEREWVGLTPTEFNSIKDTATTVGYAMIKTEAMLKEKNCG